MSLDERHKWSDDAWKCLEKEFDNPRFSDVFLQCGEKVYFLHSCVVCSQSVVLNAICKWCRDQGLLHHIFLDKGVFDLGGNGIYNQPRYVHLMLEFLYKRDYLPHEPISRKRVEQLALPSGDEWSDSDTTPIEATDPVTHVFMHSYGEFYGIPHLKVAAGEKFKESLSIHGFHPKCLDGIELAFQLGPDGTNVARDLATTAICEYLSQQSQEPLNDKIQRLLIRTPNIETAIQEYHARTGNIMYLRRRGEISG